MAKGPTVYDVAERAGVSIATVSFTFRQPDRVRPATREAVLTAAESLGYVPSASARGLARGRTGALGLFSFDFLLDSPSKPVAGPGSRSSAPNGANHEDPNEDLRLFPLYVDEVQRGVELECWRRGYALMVGGGRPTSREAILTDIAGRVDGLVVFPRSVPEDVLARISQRIPVVEVSESFRHEQLDHVTVDNAGGMHALVRHLIDVHGLTELQFVGFADSSDNVARWSGFLDALAEDNLTSPHWPQESYGGPGSAPAYVAALMAKGPLPQALVCATDQDALAIIDALSAAGVHVPEEIAVTGFDGIAAGRIVRPVLTSVRQPMEHLGRTAVELLIDRLEDPRTEPVRRELPVTLVLGGSCGCPAG